MRDADLRRLELLAAEGGLEAVERGLVEALRRGRVSPLGVELAAYLGFSFGLDLRPDVAELGELDLGSWLEGLARFGDACQLTALVALEPELEGWDDGSVWIQDVRGAARRLSAGTPLRAGLDGDGVVRFVDLSARVLLVFRLEEGQNVWVEALGEGVRIDGVEVGLGQRAKLEVGALVEVRTATYLLGGRGTRDQCLRLAREAIRDPRGDLLKRLRVLQPALGSSRPGDVLGRIVIGMIFGKRAGSLRAIGSVLSDQARDLVRIGLAPLIASGGGLSEVQHAVGRSLARELEIDFWVAPRDRRGIAKRRSDGRWEVIQALNTYDVDPETCGFRRLLGRQIPGIAGLRGLGVFGEQWYSREEFVVGEEFLSWGQRGTTSPSQVLRAGAELASSLAVLVEGQSTWTLAIGPQHARIDSGGRAVWVGLSEAHARNLIAKGSRARMLTRHPHHRTMSDKFRFTCPEEMIGAGAEPETGGVFQIATLVFMGLNACHPRDRDWPSCDRLPQGLWSKDRPAIADFVVDLPDPLKALVRRALSYTPAERPKSLAEFASLLRSWAVYLEEDGSQALVPGPPELPL